MNQREGAIDRVQLRRVCLERQRALAFGLQLELTLAAVGEFVRS